MEYSRLHHLYHCRPDIFNKITYPSPPETPLAFAEVPSPETPEPSAPFSSASAKLPA